MNLWSHWLGAHVATVVVMVLVVPFLARILRERRPQGSTLAWMLAVAVIPYVGIPLYLALGRRKQLKGGKQLYPQREARIDVEPDVARLLCADGMRAPRTGNKAELLTTGESTFETMLACIEKAKTSIRISTFIFGGDETGHAIAQALAKRAAAGVKVHLLIDGLFAFRAQRADLDELKRSGGHVAVFAPVLHVPFRSLANLRNHRKSAIFDGDVAIVGGMNLAEEYMGSKPLDTRWCDLCVRVSGPAVADIADVFAADWAFATGETLDQVPRPTEGPGPTRIQVVPSGPDSASDSFYDAILAACYSARARAWIATPYFVPDESLTRALCAAARRGKDVRVIVPARSNHRLADLAGGASLRQVEQAGGHIATFPRMLHAKAVVVDEAIGVIGSANFDMRSLFLDYELCVFLYSDRDIRELGRWFEATQRECGRLQPATASRAFWEDVGRLLAPLV